MDQVDHLLQLYRLAHTVKIYDLVSGIDPEEESDLDDEDYVDCGRRCRRG